MKHHQRGHDPADRDRCAIEIHVTPAGDDSNPGTRAAPLRTIQRAADLAQPGDTVTVHEGVYRERVNPPRGGESDTKRIVYRAAPGEKVVIKGSEIIKDWVHVQDDVWKVVLPNTLFGSYNPYRELIRGGWFVSKRREHHTGAVYLNGHWLDEADCLHTMFNPSDASHPLWFAHVDRKKTTIFAHFPGVNPNEQTAEINVRWAVFYPEEPHCDYITVRGFIMQQAATQWAPPRAEQVGLVGTHWSKGWIIEDNIISHSRCTGITLGKYGDEWDNNGGGVFTEYARRAHAQGWSRNTIGSHIVRNNTISHCEQSGITGSLGAVFSTITGNTIHDIHVRRLFSGWEPAGIKLHAPTDVEISRNRVYRAYRGIWLDWMTQGARITGNLLHDNGIPKEDETLEPSQRPLGSSGPEFINTTNCDLFIEVSHGPYLVDNNLFLSERGLDDNSQGGAYVHNLFAGSISSRPDKRVTPYHPAHSTEIAGTSDISGGDNRFYNNIFIGAKGQEEGLSVYDNRDLPFQTGGNVYLNGAKPHAREASPLVISETDPGLELVEEDGRMFIRFDSFPGLDNASTKLVTTDLLGRARIPDLPFESPDGSALAVDTDYLGKPRSREQPSPGPFEEPGRGPVSMLVW